jgi:uncharacterized protein with von Willebrand factor type A (vWA) domain
MLNRMPPVEGGKLLCARLTGFVSFLRANGLPLGLDDAALLVEAAGHVGLAQPLPLRWSAQALLCRRAADRLRFDELFDAWFLPPNRRRLVRSRGAGAGTLQRPAQAGNDTDASEGLPTAAAGAAAEDLPAGGTSQRGAASEESLAQADFRHLQQPDEVRALDELMRRVARRLHKLAERRQRAGAGAHVDVRATLRRSVSHGGEPIDLAFREPRRRRPRLVLLLDVSRSMNLYSFFFIRLARALQRAHLDTQVFIWHTHLSAVSEALRDPDAWRAQEKLQLLSAGWAGGTRIGDCLAQFEREHRRLMHARTALIVVSDGYDTGDPAQLAAVAQRLRRRARRLVWLNPLAARTDYLPLARGMQAVMPAVDLLAPAHDLASAERAFAQVLATLH